MSKFKLAIFVCALVVAAMTTSTALAADWDHIDTSDDVRVYERDLGDDVAFRGILETNTPIGKIISVFVDPNQRPHWVDRYAEHETLEQTASAEIYWLRFDMPMGVSDRDYLLRADYEFSDDTKTFTSNTRSVEDGRKGEDDCCVRADTTTKYIIEAVDAETTRITVEVQTDLKGRIPGRVVNRVQRDWPVVTLTNLVERATSSGVEIDSRVRDWQ